MSKIITENKAIMLLFKAFIAGWSSAAEGYNKEYVEPDLRSERALHKKHWNDFVKWIETNDTKQKTSHLPCHDTSLNHQKEVELSQDVL